MNVLSILNKILLKLSSFIVFLPRLNYNHKMFLLLHETYILVNVINISRAMHIHRCCQAGTRLLKIRSAVVSE